MKLLTNILAGLAGAAALNILHETLKRIDHQAPRIDLVGEEALTNMVEGAGAEAPTGNARYAATLAGDLVSNALYFSLIGIGGKKHLLLRGIGIGAIAGAGSLVITKPLGLSDAPLTRTGRTKAMTVGYYAFGGIVTAMVLKMLRK